MSLLWRFWVRDWESVDRRASFSGFRGMGGGGRLDCDAIGKEMSKAESRRLGAGCGLGLGGLYCGCCG